MDGRGPWSHAGGSDRVASMNATGVFKAVAAAALGCALLSCCASTTPPPKSDAAAASAAATNEVVWYLKGAERQAETSDQRSEIRRALEDLASLPAAELRKKRYADASMQPGQWSLATLLQKYFVPADLHSIDEQRLCDHAQRPEARTVVRAQIQAIDENRQATP